ncbi:MAG: phosphoenolpyruvate--protein phosphotransferase, partial [Ardenticatenia bacterium]
AAIFTAHLEILHDPDLLADVHARIADGVGAALAWQECIERRAEHLARVSDPLLAARAADVRDVGRLVLRLLLGVEEEAPTLPGHPVILVADDLSPSDMANLDKRRILGICTARGTPTAHVAILARALGLPAVVGVGEQVLTVENGTLAILDGDQGRLTLDPDKEVIEKARAELEKRQQTLKQAQQDAMLPAVTTDGHRVEVAANIGAPAEAHEAVQKGAEGVGLLRTEFLFLHRSQPPSEEEQAQVYRQIVEAMQNRSVIVRTLDVGGDKPAPYLPLPPEDNPFLGIRGIRLSLQYPELLRQQLRALLRASEAGALRIMFPMITTLEDWQQARAVLDEVLAETGAAPVPVGIMVEVPAVALLADVFAREVDFFSIGTNDLTQYTLAMDRQHAQLAAQADGLHPAVLRLIDTTVKAAHAAQKWVGVCGEFAADEAALPILVGLGVDEVSVSVSLVPLVKARIRRLNFAQCRQLAQQALKCATASQVRELARQFWLEHA